jgi:hypothetical protein
MILKHLFDGMRTREEGLDLIFSIALNVQLLKLWNFLNCTIIVFLISADVLFGDFHFRYFTLLKTIKS